MWRYSHYPSFHVISATLYYSLNTSVLTTHSILLFYKCIYCASLHLEFPSWMKPQGITVGQDVHHNGVRNGLWNESFVDFKSRWRFQRYPGFVPLSVIWHPETSSPSQPFCLMICRRHMEDSDTISFPQPRHLPGFEEPYLLGTCLDPSYSPQSPNDCRTRTTFKLHHRYLSIPRSAKFTILRFGWSSCYYLASALSFGLEFHRTLSSISILRLLSLPVFAYSHGLILNWLHFFSLKEKAY